jgi:serine/threonine protein kinase, bacterial
MSVTLTLLHPTTREPLQDWQFPQQSTIKIGRFPENDVVLTQFLQVSRQHLALQQTNSGEWQLINYGTNGTFVNGILITQGTIVDNSLIQLAKDGPLLRFQIANPAKTQQEAAESANNQQKRETSTKARHSPESFSTICNHAGNSPQNLFCIHCGQPIVEQEQFVRQYQILKTLGRGGMGTTYLAWDRHLSKNSPFLLVIKQMNADMAEIAKARELFEREARILKSLSHQGIPKYYDFFVENSQKYLAMELIHGQNLEQAIYQKGPVTIEQGIKWMIQVCDILSYLHSLEPPLVHRDVKPANLLVKTVDRSLVLLDFGAVKELGTPLGTRIGAEGYSAPEQNRGKPCPQSDIYAIAPTLLFLLTGRPPIQYYRRKGSHFVFDCSNITNVTPQLSRVIARISEPSLHDRFQNAVEVAEALAGCL